MILTCRLLISLNVGRGMKHIACFVCQGLNEVAEFCWFSVQILFLSKVRFIGTEGRVFAKGPVARGSIPGRGIPKTQTMALDLSLVTKVRIAGKVEKSMRSIQ